MNRFNQFVRTDYVGLPTDYYHMAVTASEEENRNALSQVGQVIDAARNVEAVYNPDKELKNSLLSDLDSKIAELSNENLTAPQTLMRIGQLVDDRDLIDGLSNIQGNTISYKAAMDSAKKYRETYGNDINLARMYDDIADYNKRDKAGFQSRFLRDYSPDKFTDIVGEIQKVLKDEKADGKTITQIGGQWMIKKGAEYISLDKLLGDAGIAVNDPKYQTQLNHLLYYNARNLGGGDPRVGYNAFYQTGKANVSQLIDDMTTDLADLKKNNTKGKNDKEIKKLEEQLSEYKDQASELDNMNPETFYRKSYMRDLAMMAAAPFDFYKETEDVNANPYALAAYRSNLSYDKALKLYKRKRQDKLNDQTYYENLNRPRPISDVVDYTDANGNKTTATVAYMTADGGYDMGRLSETIGALLNTNQKVLGLDGKEYDVSDLFGGIKKGDQKLSGTTAIKEGIKNGAIQIGVIPGTKEFVLTKDGHQYALKTDKDMDAVLSPIQSLFSTDKPVFSGEPGKMMLSLDGVNEYPVFYSKKITTDDKGVNHPDLRMWAGTSQTYKLKDLTTKDLKTITGSDASDASIQYIKDRLTASRGIVINVQGYYTRPDGNEEIVRRTYDADEFEKDMASGNLRVDKKTTFYKDDSGNVQILQDVDPGVAGSNIIGSHLTFHSGNNRRLSHVRSAESQKMVKQKVSERQVDDDSESVSLKDEED